MPRTDADYEYRLELKLGIAFGMGEAAGYGTDKSLSIWWDVVAKAGSLTSTVVAMSHDVFLSHVERSIHGKQVHRACQTARRRPQNPLIPLPTRFAQWAVRRVRSIRRRLSTMAEPDLR